VSRLQLPARIALDGASEILRCRDCTAGWSTADVRTTCAPELWRIPPRYAHLAVDWVRRHPGERQDEKVAIRAVQRGADGSLECALQPTVWGQVRPLHVATHIGQNEVVRLLPDGCEMLLPNMGVVHVIATTRDGWVLGFRRSPSSHYHPGAWSTTYEEGLAPEDVRGSEAFHRAARRGLAEELTPDASGYSLDRFRLLSVVAERPIINLAVVVAVDLPVTRAELPSIAPSDEIDAARCWAVRADLMAMRAALSGGEAGLPTSRGPWHPTARYRLLLAIARLFGEGEAAAALATLNSPPSGPAGASL
jgi:hypothetical protein